MNVLKTSKQTNRYAAKVIGLITSRLPGVKCGAVHYKCLEQDKTNALQKSAGYFDEMMILSPQSITDVQWWYNNVNCSKNNIMKDEPAIEISSDASIFEWGSCLQQCSHWRDIWP